MIRKYAKTHKYPGTYDDVVKTLRRLEKQKLARSYKQESPYQPTLWAAPGVKKPIDPDFRQHELDCADLFVAYWRFHPQSLTHWDWAWQKDEQTEYNIYKKHSILYDRRMCLDGKWFFWEVDRGTEDMDALKKKVEKYVKFSERFPDERFHVLFTLQYKRYGMQQSPEVQAEKIRERGNALLALFEKAHRGHQFLVGLHTEVLEDPLGKVFVSPADVASPISLLDL